MIYEKFFSTVLIVDDEAMLLRQVCDAVRALGYFDVRGVGSFTAAVEVLESTPLSILIADVSLPDGDGRRLATRALSLNPGLLLVMMTGFPAHALMLNPELRERAHLLEKPFEYADLEALLASCHCELPGTSRNVGV